MPRVTPLITVSGRIASGTTTVAEHLAEAYGFEMISGGDIFRQQAADHGYTLAEYTALAEDDPSIDTELNRRLADIAEAHATGTREPDGTGLILESRLAGWIAGEHADLRIWLAAPLETRVERTTDRDETIAEMQAREESEAERYQEYHGIDITDLSVYDLVVNTATFSESMVTHIVETTIDEYLLQTDTIR